MLSKFMKEQIVILFVSNFALILLFECSNQEFAFDEGILGGGEKVWQLILCPAYRTWSQWADRLGNTLK